MSEQYTFWKLLSKKKVVIPIIQRDYAQGRDGKEYIRKNFLEQLGKALGLIECAGTEKVAELDFVYGTEIETTNKSGIDAKMLPLDGQQRLTTLWLLHWYVAYKSGNLTKESVKDILGRFSYETRASSREFCEKLCNISGQQKDNESIKSFITKQTWYYSVWNQDPTIKSIMCMLSGTDNSDDKNGEFIDGIEELFKGRTDFESVWEKLTNDGCPIHFNFLSLSSSDLPLSDDLYIKMNARGKALTSFENFKADLVGYIKKNVADNEKEWTCFLDAQTGIPIKIDTDWTDIFWRNQNNGKIDDIYFAFFNRYFLNTLIVKKSSEDATGHKYLYTAEEIENSYNFKFFYGDKSNDSRIQYSSFEVYKKTIDKPILDSLCKTLTNIAKYFEKIDFQKLQPSWKLEGKFKLIPEYEDNEKNITTLTQPQRVVFYAVCKYFELNETLDDKELADWMRVVWNIVENSNIDTIQSMVGCMRLIDELSKHIKDILKFLSGKDEIESTFAKEQMAEEREKATQILDGTNCPSDWNESHRQWENWKTVIQIAESHPYFAGAIRFLYQSKDKTIDWDSFCTKWQNANTYFTNDGIKEESAVPLISALIKRCTQLGQLQDRYIFNRTTWKNEVLTEPIYITPLNDILRIECLNKIESATFEGNLICDINTIVDEDLMKVITTEYCDSRLKDGGWFYKWHGTDGILFDWTKNDNKPEKWERRRNKQLIEIEKEIKNKTIFDIKNNPITANLYYGFNINFSYKERVFVWKSNNEIDIQNGDNLTYIFTVLPDQTGRAIINKLDEYIDISPTPTAEGNL